MQHVRSSQSGFTLVEVIVSGMLIALVIAGVHGLVQSVLRAAHLAAQTTTATEMAQQKLETLLTTNYNSVASGADATTVFQRNWTVTAGANDTKNIRVDVSWRDTRGRSHSVTLSSMVPRDQYFMLGNPFVSGLFRGGGG